MDYFLARYYSSAQGRFTSPDELTGGPDDLFDFADRASANPTLYVQLGNPQSLNKYQYCYGNPLRYVDANGHDPLDPGDDKRTKAARGAVIGAGIGAGVGAVVGAAIVGIEGASAGTLVAPGVGTVGGAVLGGGAGAVAGAKGGLIIGAIGGAIVGGVIGWITGEDTKTPPLIPPTVDAQPQPQTGTQPQTGAPPQTQTQPAPHLLQLKRDIENLDQALGINTQSRGRATRNHLISSRAYRNAHRTGRRSLLRSRQDQVKLNKMAVSNPSGNGGSLTMTRSREEDAAEIGQQYFYGAGKKKSYKKAFPLLLEAAAAGEPHCQNLVGYCYQQGLGVERNVQASLSWYQRAASKEDREGLYNLALLYEKGLAVPASAQKAFALYRRAAELGDVCAQTNVAVAYLQGVGTTRNMRKGVEWLRRAARRGDARAQYNLGIGYLNGEGVRANKMHGRYWLEKAARQGHSRALRRLAALARTR